MTNFTCYNHWIREVWRKKCNGINQKALPAVLHRRTTLSRLWPDLKQRTHRSHSHHFDLTWNSDHTDHTPTTLTWPETVITHIDHTPTTLTWPETVITHIDHTPTTLTWPETVITQTTLPPLWYDLKQWSHRSHSHHFDMTWNSDHTDHTLITFMWPETETHRSHSHSNQRYVGKRWDLSVVLNLKDEIELENLIFFGSVFQSVGLGAKKEKAFTVVLRIDTDRWNA